MNYDRIILELIDRISKLETEVKLLKENNTKTDANNTDNEFNNYKKISPSLSSTKDTTKYIFDGKRYGKNRLVLAIIKKFMEDNQNTSANDLIRTFDKSLQGSLGVVRKVSDVNLKYNDSERRFFLNKDEIIHTLTDDCTVCTQWASFNINNFITRAKELGYNISQIK